MKWIKQNYPDIGNQKELADAMERWVMKYGAHMGANTLPSFYKKAYNYIAGDGKLFYNTGSNYRKQREHFQKLLDLGLPRNIAFGFAFPEVKGSSSNSIYSNHKSQTFERNKLWKELVGNSSENASSTVPASKQSIPQSSASTPVTQNNKRRSLIGRSADYLRGNSSQAQALAQTALSTPGTPQDTLMQAAPTGGGYSGGYSGYGYTGGGSGGYAAPTTATAPAGVPTIDANGQTVDVPAASQQAAAQAQSTPPAFAAPEYNSNNVRNSILSALGINTASGFQDWMKENNVTGIDNLDNLDWTTLRDNQSFMDALAKGNSALAHAISSSYDFGQYRPIGNKGEIQSIDEGNWETSGSGKNLDKFWAGWENSQDDMWKEAIKEGYIKKGMSLEDIQNGLMKTKAWQDTTNWLKASPDNMLAYLQAVKDNKKSPEAAINHFMKDKNGKDRGWVTEDENGKLHWREGYNPNYDEIFGTVRTTFPGTYWHTYTGALRNPLTRNYIQKDDGTWDEVLGDVDSNWQKINSYSWYGQGDDNNNYTYNYYKNPNAKAADAAKKEGEKNWQDDYDVLPIHRNEKLRYAGLFGPAVGLGLMAAGVGRPDTSGLDAAINAYSNRGSYLPNVRYTDGYYAYRPENPFIGDIAADNASAGTARAITNTTAPYGAQQASLLANAYNDQLARGTRLAQGRQYNNQERLQALNAYKNTDQFNAQAFNANEGVRAQILNQDRQALANMRMSAAQQKMAADAGWYNSLYGNVSGLFKGISDLGRENAQHNMIADMAANGIFGTLTPNSPVATNFLKWQKKSDSAAEGGKINRKKNKRRGGLTY
jgi:L-rhamnose mutarotase